MALAVHTDGSRSSRQSSLWVVFSAERAYRIPLHNNGCHADQPDTYRHIPGVSSNLDGARPSSNVVDQENGPARIRISVPIQIQLDGPDAPELARKMKDYADRANQGDTEALGTLAATLTPTAPDVAMVLYRRAAELGNAQAMGELARILWDEDRERATYWFELAVSNGKQQAMHNYASLVRRSQPERSLALWHQAAEGGVVRSMRALAQQLAPTDRDQARYWLEKGAALRDERSRSELERLDRRWWARRPRSRGGASK